MKPLSFCVPVFLLVVGCGGVPQASDGNRAKADIDNAVSILKRADGRFDVTCANGATEVDTSQQVLANQICLTPFDEDACVGAPVTEGIPAIQVETRIRDKPYQIHVRTRDCSNSRTETVSPAAFVSATPTTCTEWRADTVEGEGTISPPSDAGDFTLNDRSLPAGISGDPCRSTGCSGYILGGSGGHNLCFNGRCVPAPTHQPIWAFWEEVLLTDHCLLWKSSNSTQGASALAATDPADGLVISESVHGNEITYTNLWREWQGAALVSF